MWTLLIFVWAIPVVLALVIWSRIARRSRPLTPAERRWLLGEIRRLEVTPWLGVMFAVLASIFFVVGLAAGVILPNLSWGWSFALALSTGMAAVVSAALLIRFAPRRRAKRSSRRLARPREAAANLFFD